jgi:hypothetical protein
MMRSLTPIIAILLLLTSEAEAFRVMPNDCAFGSHDCILASQEGRFMEGAESWLRHLAYYNGVFHTPSIGS